MQPADDRTWTLEALVDDVNARLARAQVQAADGRVADALDARAVRYYQSLGLLDRPVRYEGRLAHYGWRALVQLLGVKLLQAQGRSLAQVQAAFAARPFEQLEAAVAAALGEPLWPGASAEVGVSGAPADPTALPVASAPAALRAWQLAPGVVVTIDPAQVADPDALVRQLLLTFTLGGR